MTKDIRGVHTNIRTCPFCGTYKQEMYRYYAIACLSNGSISYTKEIANEGDVFAIGCDCGCELTKCQDELVDKFCDKFGSDTECTENDLWGIMIDEWNTRKE